MGSLPADRLTADGARARPARVLVCDESPAMREFMAGVLDPPYELCLTASGEEALERARTFAPDVILSDLLLPGMSGSALCRRLRAEPPTSDVPFVLVTTLADADARAEGLEAGADDYLGKPVHPRELQARVAALVRLRRAMRAVEERSAALEQANRALHEAQAALVHADKLASVGMLAAGLAHEINNPLSCIKSGSAALAGFLDELHEAFDAPGEARREEGLRALAEARSIATELVEGSRRIERIAVDLRVFAGPEKVVDEMVDVVDAVDAAWTIARSRFAALPRLALERGACPPVRSCGPLVRQALLAVLENAVQAAGPGGLVCVAVRGIPDGVEVAVRDSGPGIPREILPRVFDPFFTTRPAGAASGLGLAVAYGIVNGLGGDIAVESPPGEGALFRVRLPRVPGAFARGARAASA